MSVRSSLLTPNTESGSVGLTLSVVQSTSNITLPGDGSAVIVATLNLSKGLWAITQTQKVYIKAGTAINFYTSYVQYQNSDATVWVNYISNEKYSGVVATPTADVYQENGASFVLNITSDNCRIISYGSASYITGGLVQSLTVDGGTNSLYAVKLA